MDVLEQMTDEAVLDLLKRMDEGYEPTEQEREALAGVRELDLRLMRLTRLPESMGSLTGLTELDLSGNELTSLPDWLGSLTGLTELDLSRNRLTSLPESMGSLTGLTGLYLWGNELTSLPESMGRLTGLTELDLSDNRLTSLPEWMGSLTGLTELYLWGNRLTSLPESMGRLTGLTRLYLSDNPLTSLPEWMGRLTGLTRLDLSRNQLTSLPDWMGSLTGLTRLDLSDNQLTSLPEWMGSLTGLTELYLSGNQLTSLPESMGRLTGLTYLDLSRNQLTSLPDWLGKLPRMESLWMDRLTLDRLPSSLLDPNLPFFCDASAFHRNDFKGISLENTTLSLQPVSLFDQSNDTSPHRSASRKLIKDYFQAKHIPLRESKVILLGDAGAGKTYTVRRLLNRCEKGPYQTEQTQGILIEDLHPVREDVAYTVRVWDFGGQDIMNSLHRCFLTERTCYVILVDTRNNDQTAKARHWLRTVRNVAPDAPVLLLVNRFSGSANLDLDCESLKQQYANLKDVQFCSVRDAEPGEFRRVVERPILELALGMDSCKMTLPESWEQVRQELLSMREKHYYIDRKEFHRLCDEHGVPKDDQLRVWLLNWFNDMGVCFSYHLEGGGERNTDYKILEPKWLTSAIYRLIWSKRQNRHGIITRDRIETVLGQEGSEEDIQNGVPCVPGVKYSEEECGYVLEIMRKFMISYRVSDWEEFMPVLCDANSKRDPAPEQYLQRVSYRFEYDLLPERIIHELMIYCYQRLSRGRMWLKGFWIECPAQGMWAVIFRPEGKGTADTLQIDVYATGGTDAGDTEQPYDAAFWLQPLCKKIRELNRRSNLKAEEWVLAENERGSDWFHMEDSVWYGRKEGDEKLIGRKNRYPLRPLLELVYGSRLAAAERDRDISGQGQDRFDGEAKESEVDRITPEFKDLLMQVIETGRKNTNALQENTVAIRDNTEAERQSRALLELIRDGKYLPPQPLMDELKKIVQGNEALSIAFEASQEKTELDTLRDLLGDGANCVTIGAALAKSLPVLMGLIPTLASLLM